MPKHYCDYCDVYLTHDSASVRKAHNSGRNHLANVRDYYASLGHDKAQSIIDQITSAYESGGGPPPGGFGFGPQHLAPAGPGFGPPGYGGPPGFGRPPFPPGAEWDLLHQDSKACPHFLPVPLLSHPMVLGPAAHLSPLMELVPVPVVPPSPLMELGLVVLPFLRPTSVGLVAHQLILGDLHHHLEIRELPGVAHHRRAALHLLQGQVACTLTDCE
ncbi:U1 zinc finger-domain-containing protein [Lactifluus volemus]|nr:U1 zinc finger-domain-containing protein [Lactifluus volemus]